MHLFLEMNGNKQDLLMLLESLILQSKAYSSSSSSVTSSISLSILYFRLLLFLRLSSP